MWSSFIENNRSCSKSTQVKTLLAISLIAVIAAAGAYLYRGARTKSSQPCWNKLVNLAAAKDQWALEHKATSGTPVTLENVLPYLSSAPTCHISGASYVIGKIGDAPKCTVHGTVSQFKPDRY